MRKKLHRAGTIRDLISGRIKRRDERTEASAESRKPGAKAKLIEPPIVIQAEPRESEIATALNGAAESSPTKCANQDRNSEMKLGPFPPESGEDPSPWNLREEFHQTP